MKILNPGLILITIVLLCGCPSLDISPYDTSSATMSLPVAMVSMECVLDSDENRDTMEDYIIQIMAEHPDVKLICFGETTLGWYWKTGEAEEYQRGVAEPIDGTTVSLMRSLADEYEVYISFGFTESVEGEIYNSAVLLDDHGEIIAHRHKSDFVPMDAFNGFTKGEEEVTTAFIEEIKAALLICHDFNNRDYQEEINGDQDIKMLLLPHATANLEPDFWERYRYNYEGLWMLSAQRYSKENTRQYYGSWVLDPNGYMVAFSETGPGYFYYEIGLD